MEVKLLTKPEHIADMVSFTTTAKLICHANTDKQVDSKNALLDIIKLGHESVLEHINLTYSIKGISRALLQELSRHRHISLSVESTRHTLKKQLADESPKLLQAIRELLPVLIQTKIPEDNPSYWHEVHIAWLQWVLKKNPDIPNDMLKYYLQEFWPTNLILTTNIRELRHIIKLRTAPAALQEFQDLALALFLAVPEEYRYLLEDCVYKEEN